MNATFKKLVVSAVLAGVSAFSGTAMANPFGQQFGAQSQFNAQPQFGGQAQFGGQPQYGALPYGQPQQLPQTGGLPYGQPQQLPQFGGQYHGAPMGGPIHNNLGIQLVEVRSIDDGNPAQRMGPQFRIVIKNPSLLNATEPVDLLLAASLNGTFTQGLPQIMQRVPRIEADQPYNLDFRLPVEALYMNGQMPFNALHVMLANQVDVQGNVNLQQLAVIPRQAIRLAEAKVGLPNNVTIPVGTSMVIPGEGFGSQPGTVHLNVDGNRVPLQIMQWTSGGIAVQFPFLPVTAPLLVEMIVTRPDNVTSETINVQLVPANPQGFGGFGR